MAKKTKKDSYQGDPGDEHIEKVATAPKVEIPVMENPKPKKDTWEIKDRMYRLKGGKKPLSRMIKSANLYYFDEEKGYERELKYCQNQKTTFVDEMQGDQRMDHIIFRNGMLVVEKEKTVLQKFLSLYHPERDVTYYEEKPAVRAASQVQMIELEIKNAQNGRFTHISDSTYFDTRTAEIFKRPKP